MLMVQHLELELELELLLFAFFQINQIGQSNQRMVILSLGSS